MLAVGDMERGRGRHHYLDSDKLRKDKLEKLEMMDGCDRVKHLEAQMLKKISAMDLEPKEMELVEEKVLYLRCLYL